MNTITRTTLACTAVTPDDGLNITRRYTNKNKTGINFIGLDSGVDGQSFRQHLEEAINKTGK